MTDFPVLLQLAPFGAVSDNANGVRLANQESNSDYSAVRHFAESIWVSRFSKDNLLAMFKLTCYFDASYTSPKTVSVVAGWVASVEAWERFEVDWRILLAKYNVPYLHMREFAHSVGAFTDWKGQESKRQNFLMGAADIIASSALRSFACVVEHAAFEVANNQYCLLEEIGNPYALAAIGCVRSAKAWKEARYGDTPIKYIFERGDEGRNELEKAMRWGKQPIPVFASSRDIPASGEVSTTPLQAADFAAWEIRKGLQAEETILLLPDKYRRSLRALAQQVPPDWTTFEAGGLIRLCEKFSIEPRSTKQ